MSSLHRAATNILKFMPRGAGRRRGAFSLQKKGPPVPLHTKKNQQRLCAEINFCRERTFELEKVLRWAQDKYLVWMGDGYPDRKYSKTAGVMCEN